MRNSIFSLVTLSLLLFSCGENQESSSSIVVKSETSTENGKTTISENQGYTQSTFPVVGKVGLMAVVCPDELWTPRVEKALDSVFGEYFRPFYPPQKRFEAYHLTPEEFEKRNKRVRNLMVLSLDPKVEAGKPEIDLKESYYAATQMATYISANNVKDIEAACENQLWNIAHRYDKMAWRREVIRNQREPGKMVEQRVAEKFGIHLDLPKNASVAGELKNFMRIAFPDESRPMDLAGGSYQTTRTNFNQYGIMVWQYSFTDSSLLEYQTMLNSRDTILKYNVPHEYEGVYMGTQYHPAVIPIRKQLTLNTIEGYELTGLFKFTGAMEPSGGMFWSFTFRHPKTNKVVTVSGFVDVIPTTSAVPYIRRVQAIIYSLRLDD
ncbi:protein of unknown function [Lishizhenia tianjinensis]|uniref:DUF4837 family protein n=1 Tax=Lishizhenia tianjinensis TaxID=477690 RepID=A0A1I7BGK1_9FLAO|nr:DUF4837 family protein [Lishizhenia tianjinensis]SFT86298.1 protein of unknown function [Lishizhenia tianjinensis]